jgi:hypothetical protein
MNVVFDSMRTCFFVLGGSASSSPVTQVTAYSFEERMKSRQGIPERASSSTPDTLLSLVTKEVCGTGEDAAGLCGRDARNGFPDDMLKFKSNALFYVHGRSAQEAMWSSCCALPLVLMVVGVLGKQRRHHLGKCGRAASARRSGGTAAMTRSRSPTNKHWPWLVYPHQSWKLAKSSYLLG